MKKIFTIVLLVILANISSSCYAQEANKKQTLSKESALELIELFGAVYERVKSDYVEPPSDKEAIEGAINGMLTSLDPHSRYLSAEDFKEMQVQTKGKFGGLGIEVTMKDGLVYVISPIDNTPASKAGIKAGDYISHIDGKSVVGESLSEAVKKMRGRPKTSIKVTILREGKDQPFDVEIIRDIINIQTVKHDIKGDIGYVRVTSFSGNIAAKVEAALKEIKNKIGKKNFKGVVLDLRNNPGGLLNQAIELSDLFLEKGKEIVSTKGNKKESEERSNARSSDMLNGLPLVVLINGGSASASEIVAGALKDHKRAIIMGTKSFGKGSVQTIIPLENGGAIRLTTARYYTPKGISIQAEGIVPDIVVEQSKIEELEKKPANNNESSLSGHLSNLKKAKKKEGNEAINELIKELYKEDYQLARAIDLLRAVYLYKR